MPKCDFIIIDSDKIDCFIAERIIRSTGKSRSVSCFQSAEDALEHLSATVVGNEVPVMILVNVEMPTMNGFEFLKKFAELPRENNRNCTVFLTSSSIRKSDIERADSHPLVKKFLQKPLDSNSIALILE